MKKHGLMGIWLMMLGAVVVSGTTLWGAGTPKEENPVEVRVASFGMERDSRFVNGLLRESPLQLKFRVLWSVKSPWRFDDMSGKMIQYLEVSDSGGRKLAPAEFDLKRWSITQSADHRMELARMTGTSSGELPGPEVSWLWLKGTFRVPVTRLEKSPVYEVSAVKGAEIPIVLPDTEGMEESSGSDIAEAQNIPAGKIFMQEYGTLKKQGKTVVEAEIGLETDFPFELDHLELLNDRDEVLDGRGMDGFSCENGSSKVWTKNFQFEKPEKMEKFRLRMVYKVSKGEVSVPVDVRLGCGGKSGRKSEGRLESA